MFGAPMLDVAIGMFFLYFVLSIVSSAIMETIAMTLALRSRTMFSAIDGLLDGLKGLGITTTDFFTSPHIAPLALDEYKTKKSWWDRLLTWLGVVGKCPGNGKGVPTYIPADRFSTALLALMQASKNETPSPPQFLKLAAAVKEKVLPPAPPAVLSGGSSAQNAPKTDDNPPPALHAAHLFVANTEEALGPDASDGDRLKHLRDQFDKWYSDTMDRASGWYKRTTQKWIFFIGCALVIGLNIDSIALIQRLSHDPAARTWITQAAVAATQANQGTDASAATQMKSQVAIHNELTAIDNAALPLGWHSDENWSSSKKIGGLLLTIFAISLGAPFWFGVLSLAVNLRAAGPVPQDPTKTPPPGTSPASTVPSPGGGGTVIAEIGPGNATPPSPLADDYWSAAKRKEDWNRFQKANGIFETGAAMARCAVLAYENDFFVRSVLMGSWNLPMTAFCTFLNPGGTQAFVAVVNDAIIVAFRGTQPGEFADIIDDACCNAVERPDLGTGRVSIGFAASLDERMLSVDECVTKLCNNGNSVPNMTMPKRLFVTGHSLGGALATLYASHAALKRTAGAPGFGSLEVHLCTFGSPRVGDAAFAKALEIALGYRAEPWQEKIDQRLASPEALATATRILRYVDHNDIVTRVPPDDVFTHAGPVVYLTASGNYDLTMTQAKRFEGSLMDVVTGFKALAVSSLADHASGKYLNILEMLAKRS